MPKINFVQGISNIYRFRASGISLKGQRSLKRPRFRKLQWETGGIPRKEITHRAVGDETISGVSPTIAISDAHLHSPPLQAY